MDGSVIDIILLVLTVALVWAGWIYGFVRTAGSLIGLVLSLGLAFYGVSWLESTFNFSATTNPVLGVTLFLVMALIVSHVAGWIVSLLDLARKVISIIPFVGLMNRTLGAILGFVQSALVIFGLVFVVVRYIPAGTYRDLILSSNVVARVVDVAFSFGWL